MELKDIKLTKEEIEIIRNALVEYEENHYESESQGWQYKINNLIDNKFRS